jgi:conjugative transfer signal peptidase TraF
VRRQSNIPVRALAIGIVAIGALGLASLFSHDFLLYNHSTSIPRGIYLRVDAPIGAGSIVTVRAIDVAPAYARRQHFTDAGDRFIKRVAAANGDEVCASGPVLQIHGRVVARRSERDSEGRALPTWSGCRVLSEDEVFLLGDTDDSFDGRYWGPISRDQIEGVWRFVSF